MYPFKFHPILKQTIWGGERIVPFKHLHSDLHQVGESWELSNVPGDESVVANGSLAGKTITQLVRTFKEDLVGESNYNRFGDIFPLLIKFIDARQDLSIQVHPDDDLAQKRHDSLGKSEMWYVIDAEPGARLLNGLSQEITPGEYKERVKKNTLTDVLQTHEVQAGDVFYIPAGRIHSIGAGVFLAEIQETSTITYRIYDYHRRDAHGNLRELHTELAKDAIDYEVYDDYATDYEHVRNEPVELLVTPYFTTSLYDLDEELVCDYSELDSFVVFVCLEGKATLVDDECTETEIAAGEVVLFPARTQEVTILPDPKVKLLETYV